MENHGADMKPTAVTPDGIDAAMFKQLAELNEALNAVSSSKLEIGLVQSAAEYCIGEIKGHVSHGAADMSVEDVKAMADAIISTSGNVTDAAHDADELLRALQDTQSQTAALNPNADVIEREIWVLWMATLDPNARILDNDPIEDYLAAKGLVTKTWWYSKSDETKDIERAKASAKDLEARRAAAGLPGGGGEGGE
jgi:hypothetical protein